MTTSLRRPIVLSILAACACAQAPVVGNGDDDPKRVALASVQAVDGSSSAAAAQRSVDAADQEFLHARLPGARVHTQGGRVVRMVGEAMATGKTPDESAETFRKGAALALGVSDDDLQPSGFDGGPGALSQRAAPLDLQPHSP